MAEDRRQRIALIAQGPSAPLYAEIAPILAELYVAVIGVNEIPTRYACNWWSFSDPGTYRKYYKDLISHADGSPRVCTKKKAASSITKQVDLTSNRTKSIVTYDEFDLHDDTKAEFDTAVRGNWMRYSGPPALLFALHLAKKHDLKRVDCYGCDMSGSVGFDPEANKVTSRTPMRWAKESKLWQAIIAEATINGIGVQHARRASDGVLVEFVRFEQTEAGISLAESDAARADKTKTWVVQPVRQWQFRNPETGRWCSSYKRARSEEHLRTEVLPRHMSVEDARTTDIKERGGVYR